MAACGAEGFGGATARDRHTFVQSFFDVWSFRDSTLYGRAAKTARDKKRVDRSTTTAGVAAVLVVGVDVRAGAAVVVVSGCGGVVVGGVFLV